MITVTVKNFDLEKTGRSGQCFRMNRLSGEKNRYSLIAYGEYLEASQEGETVRLWCTKEEWENRWKEYFDCGTDYGRIYDAVDKEDKYLAGAVRFGSGIRILRQELFETIICFIISQQNNISRIRKCVEALCNRYGEKRLNLHGEEYHVFPTPERLSSLTCEELSRCHLGYRDKYIIKASKQIVSGEVDIKGLPRMGYGEAKKELMKLCGVGVKVAECVCLFSLHHTDAFPVDTHIRSVLTNYYPEGFPLSRYQGFAGILQQYAFFYDLYGEKTSSSCEAEARQ